MDKLIDRLGERLDGERRKIALCEALLDRVRRGETGPPVVEIEHMREVAERHRELLAKEILERGGDPILATPSAQSSEKMSSGLARLVEDPASTPQRCVEALASAELIHHAAWGLLVELAAESDPASQSGELERALADEEEELERVRGWMAEAVLEHPRRMQRRRTARPRRGNSRGVKVRAGVPGILDEQHRRLDQLFKRLAREATRSGRRMVFDQLIAQLALHERLEGGVLSPWLREHTDEDVGALSIDETVRQKLAELEQIGTDAEGFGDALERLRADVERHVATLESHLLQRFDELVSEGDRALLAEALRESIDQSPPPPVIVPTPPAA